MSTRPGIWDSAKFKTESENNLNPNKMRAIAITWDAFEMISGAQYPAYLISVVQKVLCACSVGFSVSWDLTRLRSQLKTQISQTKSYERHLGFCRFRGKFLECVCRWRCCLLLKLFRISHQKQKTQPIDNSGLLRGSVPGTKSSMDRPTSLPTRGHASFSPSSSVDRHNDPVTNG